MRRVLATALACSAFTLTTLPARAQRLDEIFAAGHAAAYRGDWDEASRQYEALLSVGVDDPDVHFDAAVAHAHRGELGRAVLGFERALWLSPGDAAAREGLGQTLSVLGHRRAEREGEATVRARPPLAQALVQPFSETSLAVLLLVFDLLVFALLGARRRVTTESARVAFAMAWPLAALLGVVTAGALAVKTDAFADGRAAIVLRDGAALREGPAHAAPVRGAVPAGAYARVLEREGDFARVRVDRKSGWMHSDDVATIRPD